MSELTLHGYGLFFCGTGGQFMPDIVAIVVLVVALVLWIKSVQRSLVVLGENTNNTLSQIGIQLSSLWHSLASIMDLAKDYDVQEYVSLTEVFEARRLITKDSKPEDVEKQELIIAELVKNILAAAESNPNLKADESYLKSMDAVNQYKKMINTSSLIYNESANRLNRAIRMFPSSIIACILGFSKRTFLKDVDDGS
jgi:Uncharacterized conserved protein